MTSPSPSEFLTFMRTVARPASACLRQSLNARASIAPRTFVSSTRLNDVGNSTEKTHATDKTDKLDVQSANSADAQAAKSQSTGGTATQQRDVKTSTARAKKDHPEAPDVVIGMQDERGGKGA